MKFRMVPMAAAVMSSKAQQQRNEDLKLIADLTKTMLTSPAHTTEQEDTMTAYRNRLNAGQHAPPPPPNEATIPDLQAQLRLLGQPVSGTKQELIDRLEQATAQPQSEEDDT